jgi:hypothetical protein
MHPELDALLYYGVKQAMKLRETGQAPFFAAVLDEGRPTLLNPEIDPDYKLPPSSAGKVEFLRSIIRKYPGVTGGLFCAPAELQMSDGTTYQATILHFDHIEDSCAYTVTLPFNLDAQGEVEQFKPIVEETDDRIFPA